MEELLNQSFGADLWNITNELSRVSSQAFSNIRNAALLLGFLVLIFQLFIIMWQSHKDDLNAALRIPQRLIALFLQVGLITAILTTGAYNFLYVSIIGYPPQLIATNISVIYIDSLQSQWASLYQNASWSASGVWSFITATLSESLLSTLIASFVYAAAAIVTFLVPIVLGKLYLYMYYIGPIALIFTFCDYTSNVAKSWLNLSLSIAWAGVFGSIALLISVNGGILSGLSDGVTSKDWISTAVYGIVSIALMVLSFPISQYFFGAMGSGLSNMANPVSMIGNATSTGSQAAIAGGATAAIAGSLLTSLGSRLGSGGNSDSQTTKSGKGSFSSQSFESQSASNGGSMGPQNSNVPGGSFKPTSNNSSSSQSISTVSSNNATQNDMNISSSAPKTKLQSLGDLMNKVGNSILTAGSISSTNAPMTQRTANEIDKQLGNNQQASAPKSISMNENSNNKRDSLKEEEKESERA